MTLWVEVSAGMVQWYIMYRIEKVYTVGNEDMNS
jgi:hypothetical protein